jgi:hypothetical protein
MLSPETTGSVQVDPTRLACEPDPGCFFLTVHNQHRNLERVFVSSIVPHRIPMMGY